MRTSKPILVSIAAAFLVLTLRCAPAGAATPKAGNQCKKKQVNEVIGELKCTQLPGPKYVWQRVPIAPATGNKTPKCDPNYSPCVPIDSDVDCARGSGNGPSYVRGPVRVIGDDVYGLDSDGDGIGCEN